MCSSCTRTLATRRTWTSLRGSLPTLRLRSRALRSASKCARSSTRQDLRSSVRARVMASRHGRSSRPRGTRASESRRESPRASFTPITRACRARACRCVCARARARARALAGAQHRR
eukprot:Amastigsp_a351788_23.p4 type:complete len:117 gc:universal Amastigsp_a351788_23:537-887(+)